MHNQLYVQNICLNNLLVYPRFNLVSVDNMYNMYINNSSVLSLNSPSSCLEASLIQNMDTSGSPH
jgi:hypothetical protein